MWVDGGTGGIDALVSRLGTPVRVETRTSACPPALETPPSTPRRRTTTPTTPPPLDRRLFQQSFSSVDCLELHVRTDAHRNRQPPFLGMPAFDPWSGLPQWTLSDQKPQDGMLVSDVGGTPDIPPTLSSSPPTVDPWSCLFLQSWRSDQKPHDRMLVSDVGGTPDNMPLGGAWSQPLQQGSLLASAGAVNARQGSPRETEVAAVACSVRLRGLPFSASQQDVLALFSRHGIAEHITDGANAVELRRKQNGGPTGHAVVRLRTLGSVRAVVEILNGQYLGTRLIEAFPHSAGS